MAEGNSVAGEVTALSGNHISSGTDGADDDLERYLLESAPTPDFIAEESESDALQSGHGAHEGYVTPPNDEHEAQSSPPIQDAPTPALVVFSSERGTSSSEDENEANGQHQEMPDGQPSVPPSSAAGLSSALGISPRRLLVSGDNSGFVAHVLQPPRSPITRHDDDPHDTTLD